MLLQNYDNLAVIILRSTLGFGTRTDPLAIFLYWTLNFIESTSSADSYLCIEGLNPVLVAEREG